VQVTYQYGVTIADDHGLQMQNTFI